jgi:hypothetical protein
MNWCKLFGHNWQNYKQGVPHIMSSGYKFMVDTDFRFCVKCSTNQIRVAHTSKNEIDWKNCELNSDQLRDKKLKELGL